MATDIAIDNNGDLIFAKNRDYALVSGTAQIEQRIRARLLLPIGTVLSGDDTEVGADLHLALRITEKDEVAFNDLALRVQEALAPIAEILVQDVNITVNDHRQLEITVLYSTV